MQRLLPSRLSADPPGSSLLIAWEMGRWSIGRLAAGSPIHTCIARRERALVLPCVSIPCCHVNTMHGVLLYTPRLREQWTFVRPKTRLRIFSLRRIVRFRGTSKTEVGVTFRSAIGVSSVAQRTLVAFSREHVNNLFSSFDAPLGVLFLATYQITVLLYCTYDGSYYSSGGVSLPSFYPLLLAPPPCHAIARRLDGHAAPNEYSYGVLPNNGRRVPTSGKLAPSRRNR